MHPTRPLRKITGWTLAGLLTLTVSVAVWRWCLRDEIAAPPAVAPRDAPVRPRVRPVNAPSQGASPAATPSTVLIQAAEPSPPTFDRAFIGAAARSYVEAYEHQHRHPGQRKFSWDSPTIVFAPLTVPSASLGYLAVLFPVSDSTGAGFACFRVDSDEDHLTPLVWGYSTDLTRAANAFPRTALTRGCLAIDEPDGN